MGHPQTMGIFEHFDWLFDELIFSVCRFLLGCWCALCAMADTNLTKRVQWKHFFAIQLPRTQHSFEYKRVFVDLVRNQGTAEALRRYDIFVVLHGRLGSVGLRI